MLSQCFGDICILILTCCRQRCELGFPAQIDWKLQLLANSDLGGKFNHVGTTSSLKLTPPRKKPGSVLTPLLARSWNDYQPIQTRNPSAHLIDWGVSRENAELSNTPGLVFSQQLQKLKTLGKNKAQHFKEVRVLT